MKKVNIYEAKTRLSQLVAEAASGRDVIIARAGVPAARLTQIEKAPRKRRLGILDGRFRIPEDFNRPLPDELLRSFEGE
jgi:prevent-host-death family protein